MSTKRHAASIAVAALLAHAQHPAIGRLNPKHRRPFGWA